MYLKQLADLEKNIIRKLNKVEAEPVPEDKAKAQKETLYSFHS